MCVLFGLCDVVFFSRFIGVRFCMLYVRYRCLSGVVFCVGLIGYCCCWFAYCVVVFCARLWLLVLLCFAFLTFCVIS